MAYVKRGKNFGTFSNVDFHGTDLLKKFSRSFDTGEAIAALKCFLYLSSHVDFKSRNSEIKYDDFMRGTGLSRPMISRGLKLLMHSECSLLRKGSKRSQYVLNELTDEFSNLRFSKVPIDTLITYLKSVPNKGKKSKNALVLYIYFLTIRTNSQPIARVSYETIENKIGLNRNDIKPSLCILYESNLLTCLSPQKIKETNRYHISGLELGKDQFIYHPSGYNYEGGSLEYYLASQKLAD